MPNIPVPAAATGLPDTPHHEELTLMRKRIEVAVEGLVALLDHMDGDPDMEPSLGYTPYISNPALADVEGDDAESGIADWDGLDEQMGGDARMSLARRKAR